MPRTAKPFMDRVLKTEGCWLWMGARRQPTGRGGWGGYGHYVPKRGVQHYAHRFSWQMHCGPIPEGMMVLHKCDNPRCVKPDHLFLGTHQDNMDDAKRKGRVRNQNSYVTSCPKGHLYDEENTSIRRNKRYCKACDRITSLSYYHRKKDQHVVGG